MQDFSNGHRKVLLMTSLASIFKILDKLENVESRNSFPLFCRDKGFFKNFLFKHRANMVRKFEKIVKD